MSPIMLSLFDYSGNSALPWASANYTCYLIDKQHPQGTNPHPTIPNTFTIGADLLLPLSLPFPLNSVKFISAFPPCDHLAISGARWFKGKGLRALAKSIELFAVATDICESSSAPYYIENPVSTISTYWRKPDYIFSPHHYSSLHPRDNYTKTTCLWVGNNFIMPTKKEIEGLLLSSKLANLPPSPQRANLRSKTPLGFSLAVFEANHRNGLP